MSVLFTDPFTGTDADLGVNWTVNSSYAAWRRTSDAATVASLASDSAEFVNSVTPPDAQYAQVPVTTDNGNADNNFNGGGPAVRMSTTVGTWYSVVAKNDRITMIEGAAGSFASLGSFTVTWVDGDVLYIEAQGDQIIAKINGITRIGPVTDATTASGRFGLVYGSTVTSISCDDFEGGDFAAAGGTILPLADRHYRGMRAA